MTPEVRRCYIQYAVRGLVEAEAKPLGLAYCSNGIKGEVVHTDIVLYFCRSLDEAKRIFRAEVADTPIADLDWYIRSAWEAA